MFSVKSILAVKPGAFFEPSDTFALKVVKDNVHYQCLCHRSVNAQNEVIETLMIWGQANELLFREQITYDLHGLLINAPDIDPMANYDEIVIGVHHELLGTLPEEIAEDAMDWD